MCDCLAPTVAKAIAVCFLVLMSAISGCYYIDSTVYKSAFENGRCQEVSAITRSWVWVTCKGEEK